MELLLHTPEKRTPKVLVQWAEQLFPALKEDMRCTIFVKVLPGCSSGICVSSCSEVCRVAEAHEREVKTAY
jgi:hypothetical protein